MTIPPTNPHAISETASNDVNTATRMPKGSRATLLLVDDDPINIQVLYQVFVDDYEIFMASNGAQALMVCANQQPDLVLLDIEMPDINGFDVCKRLKADPVTQDIPIIFVTAHNNVLAETHGLDAGAVDFISKPINAQIVRARVKTHIALKTQADLIRSWVYIDALTNLHNRRYFDEHLAMEWGRAVRNGTSLSIVFLDVDFFKRYNDHYGHLAGDECLRRVAICIQTCMKRFGDMAARFGGEEFVCLLPDTDLQGALQFAEQLRLQIMDLNIEHITSPIIPRVTVSLGIASRLDNSFNNAIELLELADKQLYLAKQRGRNQICASASKQA